MTYLSVLCIFHQTPATVNANLDKSRLVFTRVVSVTGVLMCVAYVQVDDSRRPPDLPQPRITGLTR